MKIMRSVTAGYVNGVPKHVSASSDSNIACLSYSRYVSLGDGGVNRLLRDKMCIVVTDMPWPDMQFDEDGLSSLSVLDAVVSIQGGRFPRFFYLIFSTRMQTSPCLLKAMSRAVFAMELYNKCYSPPHS